MTCAFHDNCRLGCRVQPAAAVSDAMVKFLHKKNYSCLIIKAAKFQNDFKDKDKNNISSKYLNA